MVVHRVVDVVLDVIEVGIDELVVVVAGFLSLRVDVDSVILYLEDQGRGF